MNMQSENSCREIKNDWTIGYAGKQIMSEKTNSLNTIKLYIESENKIEKQTSIFMHICLS